MLQLALIGIKKILQIKKIIIMIVILKNKNVYVKNKLWP